MVMKIHSMHSSAPLEQMHFADCVYHDAFSLAYSELQSSTIFSFDTSFTTNMNTSNQLR